MIKNCDGFIFIDTTLTLLILSLTLTSVYGLVIKSIQFENRLIKEVSELIMSGEEYYEDLKNIITE
jgi:hypothetical protein